MGKSLEILETLLTNVLGQWLVSIQRWSDEQNQAFLRIAQIGTIDIRLALGAMALYLLGSAERLGNLLLDLFRDIPQAALETALELVLKEIPSSYSQQTVKRSTAIQDCVRGIVEGGLQVSNLDFPLGIKVSSFILKVKKIFDVLGSRTAQNVYMKLIPNAPVRFGIAVMKVAAVVWKGVSSFAFLCLLYVMVRRIALGHLFVPMFQGKRRKRIRLRSYARIPAVP